MADPLCYWCEYAGRGKPCRSRGVRDFEQMATAFVSHWEATTAGGTGEDHAWIGDCVGELEREAPEAALYFILLTLDRLKSGEVLAVLAAGPLENALSHGGAQIIDRVERIAKLSPKFRLLLSGIWGCNRIAKEVWARASAAVAAGPCFCDDPRTVSHGGNAGRVSEEQLRTLIATRAIDDLGGIDAARVLAGVAEGASA